MTLTANGCFTYSAMTAIDSQRVVALYNHAADAETASFSPPFRIEPILFLLLFFFFLARLENTKKENACLSKAFASEVIF